MTVVCGMFLWGRDFFLFLYLRYFSPLHFLMDVVRNSVRNIVNTIEQPTLSCVWIAKVPCYHNPDRICLFPFCSDSFPFSYNISEQRDFLLSVPGLVHCLGWH